MKKSIEKQLHADLQSYIDEYDIEGEIKRLVEKKRVKGILDGMIKDEIAKSIQDRAFLRIQKQMPLIDAYTNEKVQEFLYSIGVK